jgi:diguanylate cyclase
MTTSAKIIRILQVAGALAIVCLGALSETRLQNDPTTAVCVFALIAIAMTLVGWGSLGAPATGSADLPATQRKPLSSPEEQQLDSTLVRICRLIQDHLTDSAQFTDRLKGASRRLSQLAPGDPIDEIILSLITDNREMQKKVSTLSEKLETSRSKIYELQRNLSKAEEINAKDSLTSVGSRRYFDECLSSEVSNANQNNEDLSLIMIDLDHFKRINDDFGHVVGDTLLKLFAELLASNIKGKDKASRYGGEEFTLIFPSTRAGDAARVAEQIRKQLEAKRWVVGRSGQRIGKVTASFGIAGLKHGESDESLLRRADAMLYKAKSKGRNRIEVDDSDDVPTLRQFAAQPLG